MGSAGFHFIYYGDTRFEDEAVISIRRIRELNPNVGISVACDREPCGEIKMQCTYRVFQHDSTQHSFAPKLQELHRLPFDRNIILDTDVYLIEDVSEFLFGILDCFDIACVQSEGNRVVYNHITGKPLEINKVWTNGLMSIRKSGPMVKLLKQLPFVYSNRKSKGKGSNNSFTSMLHQSKLKIMTLPEEYNYRFRGKPYKKGVKVLHGAGSAPRPTREDYERWLCQP